MLRSIWNHTRGSRRFASVAEVNPVVSEGIEQRCEKYIAGTYGKRGREFVRGDGAYMFDRQGKMYLDFGSGIAVSALGHQHPRLVKALQDHSQELWHTSNLYYSTPQVDLAERLVKSSGFSKAFFCNSGTEANEAAVKFAKKLKGDSSKQKMIAFKSGFHGRSMGSLSLTHKPAIRTPYEPLLPNVEFLPFNDIDAVRKHIDSDTCAVIVEPVQGEGGVRPATVSFMKAIREACTSANAAMIVDEVQIGMGRSGHLWCHSAFNVEPDMMTLAKPLAGGLPIGAALLNQRVSDSVEVGDHGSTFGGNPLVCGVAVACFDEISQPDFLKNVAKVGELIFTRLLDLSISSPHIIDVRSVGGLLLGIDVTCEASKVIDEAAERGLVILSAGPNTLRLAPPLIIRKDQANWAIDTLKESIEAVAQ